MQSQQLLWKMTTGMTKHEKYDVSTNSFQRRQVSLPVITLQELMSQYCDQSSFTWSLVPIQKLHVYEEHKEWMENHTN